MKKTKEKKGKNTSVLSFSIDKAVEQKMNSAFELSGETSKSKFVSNLIRFSLNKKEYLDFCSIDENYPHDGGYKKIPDEVYSYWYNSMYIKEVKDFITSDDNWFILDTSRVAIYDENSEFQKLKGEDRTAELNEINELSLLNEKLISLYSRIKERKGIFSLGSSFFSRIVYDIFRSEKIKILAIRVNNKKCKNDKLYESDYEYHNFTYLITIINSDKNLNGKSHYYLDYHSIKMVSASSLYESPIRDIVRSESGGVPLHYLHWIPIRTYNQYFILLGVKRRKYSKAEIDHVRKNKIIIVNAT
ncbi:hypothetical protein LET06_03135 [Pectobacterium versatile]|uniref:hypothetical protein n=1 Tax=Pectobacterium TaxID=122277 RepID=UPI000F647A9F|nr:MULTISPECIES: hypothetical protein [Pectobacterium]MCA5929959.1 hypothetical protein [Pectobacterium versatile]MCA5947155.1 hypothetical protein [Pectobacterium versatile]MCA5951557.1 hypothetical protein [Pectobacterium versatile]RRO06354.1 hypothetical protein DMB81_012875 [Pectobacterium aquaticum]UCP86696.1 hypothetical protein LGL96_03420 [Pectobacterium versatile]